MQQHDSIPEVKKDHGALPSHAHEAMPQGEPPTAEKSAASQPSLVPLVLSHGHATLKGRFHANEDRVSITALPNYPDSSPRSPAGCLVLLCDGHDGLQCATFVQSHFPRDLPVDNAGTALTRAFAHVEGEWIAHVRSAQSRGIRRSGGISSGACVTAVLVRGTHITAANVGDSRAIFRRADGSVAVLTDDHRCANPTERERILRLGGPGAIRNGRVVGVLEPTRTIGDLEEKLVAGPDVISSVPFVAEVELSPSELGGPPCRGSGGGTEPGAARASPLAATSAPPPPAAAAALGGARCLPVPAATTSRAAGLLSARAALTSSLMSRSLAATMSGALAAQAAYSGGVGLRSGPPPTRVHARGAPPPPLSVAEAVATARMSRISCLIVASDGVWDVMPSGAAAAVVVHVLERRRDPAAAAAELVALAQRLGSADDITAAVVWLEGRPDAAADLGAGGPPPEGKLPEPCVP